MRTTLLLFVCSFFLGLSFIGGQNVQTDAYNAAHAEYLQNASAVAAMPGLCPSEPCPCAGGFTEMRVYYFGEDNVTVDVFANKLLTQPITSFSNVVSGQLLTLSGAGLPGGVLSPYSFFRVTSGGGTVCVTSIYSRCPSNVWPGSLEDLKVIGKTFGEFTVYSHRDESNNYNCTIDEAGVKQDWRVGGNVIGAAANTLGSLNDADVVFITGNTPRGTITQTGNFGIGTTSPVVRLDVAGAGRISQSLDVIGATTVGANFTVQPAGLTRLLSNAASTDINSGALVVTGGFGLGGNLHTGGTATIAGHTRLLSNAASTDINSGALVVTGGFGLGGNLHTGGTATIAGQTRLLSNAASTDINSGALVVTGGIGLGGNLHTGGTATIAGLTTVNNSARITGNLNLHGRLILGAAETAGLRIDAGNLRLENATGEVRITASNEEMMIVKNTEVEVKKRLIVTGADLAERFEVVTAQNTAPQAGMVLSIDKNNPGKLVVSSRPYDKTVAGIVSGANGINTAMLLGQAGTIADGDVPVAIVGRVFCHADADNGSIEPGDLLTTSATPGHVMKVTDDEAARGAVIGKAMTGLGKGKGLILVLISMQ